jgi:hypothetical protein
MTCPISREQLTAHTAFMASDGHLYDADSLKHWAESCADRMEPLTSPVTREVLRPWACPAAEALHDAGFRDAALPVASDVIRLRSLAPPFPPMVPVRRGTQRASSWSSSLGIACRMLLGWDDGDVVEWCVPIDSCFSRPRIATPAPVRELLPLAAPVLSWLAIDAKEFSNPTHILTAWVRVIRPRLDGEDEEDEGRDTCWETLEILLLRLNRSDRTRA